jgi:hypothetical protein
MREFNNEGIGHITSMASTANPKAESRVLWTAFSLIGKCFGFVLTIDAVLSFRRSWREDISDLRHFLHFFLQYIAPTLGLFMHTLAYCIPIVLALYLPLFAICYGRNAWERLGKSDTVLPVATGIAFVATIVQIALWEPALLEPGGLRYSQFRHMGIVTLWVFIPAFVILAVLLLVSQVSRRPE